MQRGPGWVVMAGNKLDESHNTMVDCEPELAMVGSITGGHGWPQAGSGIAMDSSITGNHRT